MERFIERAMIETLRCPSVKMNDTASTVTCNHVFPEDALSKPTGQGFVRSSVCVGLVGNAGLVLEW